MSAPADREPSLWRLAAEASAPIEIATGRLLARAIGRRRSAAHPRDVLVLPGFLKDDRATASLRAALDAAGHRSFGWDMGRNLGAAADTLDRLRARIDAMGPAPVALVGWSLGGLFARELAKLHPARIERVVTLGTPFSGSAQANHAWRLYERIAGHPVDRPPIAVVRHEKPPVFTIALWSRRDGIVAPAASRGLAGEADIAIEVRSGHVAFAASAPAIRAVLNALAMPVVQRAEPPGRSTEAKSTGGCRKGGATANGSARSLSGGAWTIDAGAVCVPYPAVTWYDVWYCRAFLSVAALGLPPKRIDGLGMTAHWREASSSVTGTPRRSSALHPCG